MTHEQNTHIAQAVGMLNAQLDAAKVLSSGPAYDEAWHCLECCRHPPPGPSWPSPC
jgi:hypothetical protein